MRIKLTKIEPNVPLDITLYIGEDSLAEMVNNSKYRISLICEDPKAGMNVQFDLTFNGLNLSEASFHVSDMLSMGGVVKHGCDGNHAIVEFTGLAMFGFVVNHVRIIINHGNTTTNAFKIVPYWNDKLNAYLFTKVMERNTPKDQMHCSINIPKRVIDVINKYKNYLYTVIIRDTVDIERPLLKYNIHFKDGYNLKTAEYSLHCGHRNIPIGTYISGFYKDMKAYLCMDEYGYPYAIDFNISYNTDATDEVEFIYTYDRVNDYPINRNYAGRYRALTHGKPIIKKETENATDY